MNLGDDTASPGRHPARLAAAALSAVAAVLAVAGAFLPLFRARQDLGYQDLENTFTSFHVDMAGGASLDGVPRIGYPLVCAGTLLACAALVCWHAAKPGASQGIQRATGVLTAAGGAFLACAVWSVALQVSYWEDAWSPPQDLGGLRTGGETSILAGYWVLLVAAALGLAAAAPALLPDHRPVPPPTPVDPDAPTPPYGLALQASPEPEQERPTTTVVPLTGHPSDSETVDQPSPPTRPANPGPIVIPEAAHLPEPAGPAIPLTDDPLAEPPSRFQ